MYCSECGKKNDDNSRYCEHCGHIFKKRINPSPRLKEAYIETAEEKDREAASYEIEAKIETESFEPVENMQRAEKQKKREKRVTVAKVLILSVQVVVCIAVFVFFWSYGNQVYGAERAAGDYFAAYSSNQFSKAYQYLILPEDEFLTVEMYAKTFADKEILTYSSLTVSSQWQEGDKAIVDIKYSVDGQEYTTQLTMTKVDKKNYLFFPEWKVEADSLLATNTNLLLPKEAEAALNGIVLADSYINESIDSFVNYKIPYLFVGNQLLEVTAKDKEDVKELLAVPDMDGYQYYGEELELSQELKTQLTSSAVNALFDIYTAAMNRESFQKIDGLFSSQEEINQAMKEAYENFAADICDEDGYGLKEITFDEITSSVEITEQGDVQEATVNLQYKYESQYQKLNDKNELESTKDSKEEVCLMTLVLEDGIWKVKDF